MKKDNMKKKKYVGPVINMGDDTMRDDDDS
jgi:hypothetical protein